MKCRYCNKGNVVLKDEITYVYHYHIGDDDLVNWTDEEVYTPYLFFNREQKYFKRKAQCDHCHREYDFKLKDDGGKQMIILKKAIHSNVILDKEPFV